MEKSMEIYAMENWKTIYRENEIPQVGKREQCITCGGVFGSRVRHFPCWIHSEIPQGIHNIKGKGGIDMPIDDKAFDNLKGEPRGGFAQDENSLTQRILRTMKESMAYTADEIAKSGEVKGEELKRVKTVCNNMTRAASKKGKPKLEKKYDDNGTAYYRKVIATEDSEGAAEGTDEEE